MTLMGREVQTLVNESLKPGTYEVTFNIESATEHRRTFGSGVYFYKLMSGWFYRDKEDDFNEIKYGSPRLQSRVFIKYKIFLK